LFAWIAAVLLVWVSLAIWPVRRLLPGRSSIKITAPTPTSTANGNITTPTPASTANDKFLAILPLVVMGSDPALKYEGEGVADALSAKLLQMKDVHLAFTPEVDKVDPSDPLDIIAHRLHATHVVRGQVKGAGDRIDIILTLGDADGDRLWTNEFPGLRRDLLAIEEQAFKQLMEALELKPSAEELARIGVRPTKNIAAYELYRKGRYEHNRIKRGKRDIKWLEWVVDLYGQAIDKDPAFALAYAGLADASLDMYDRETDAAWSRKALEAAQHAQRLNDELPESHFSLAKVYEVTGQTVEAIAELQRALKLAPDSDEGYRRLANAYLSTGQADQALQAYQRAIDANPYYWLNYNQLGAADLQLGRIRRLWRLSARW